ncbi:uncharacterized protein LOC8074268 isoform X2 [Sorghum bicolor]|uniref:Calmodulin-binding domain-containing protein n=1 Tax=Sorghum bicolor TaxID=4558 RepID=C5YQD9_SORBI|nr:uncharacterized protein LOC8074268 isoform X2 [Sorghum bicolor]EES17258.2 hypothetical protein SORBI_3008G141600 [Sorghum bicolor]|eukprot:XP_002442384.2 uncharacterized protein LOC8074268 isoform X2 [Sorghum bicolor]
MTEEVIKEAIVTSTPASAEPKCGDLLINSPVIMDGSGVTPDVKRKEKPVPHYLRASTSSCHDNCKYGIKHSSEPKKYWPVSRKQLRRASTGNQELDRVQIVLPQKYRPTKEDQKLKVSHVKGGNSTAPAKPEFITLKAPLESVPDHSESIPCVEDSSAEASELAVAGTLPIVSECFVVSHDDVTDCGDGESLDAAESIELEMPLAIQDIDESDEHIEDTILPADSVCGVEEQSLVDHVPDQSANECASSDIRTPQTVIASEKHDQAGLGTKSESLSKGPVKPKAKATSSITRDKGSSQKNGRTPHLTSTSTAVDSSSGPKTARKPADVTVTTKFSNTERKSRPTVTSAVQKAKEIKVRSASNSKDSSGEPSRLAKLKASTMKTAPSPSLPSGKQTNRKMTGNNVGKNPQILPKKREEKVKIGPLKLSRSLNLSGKSLSGVKLRTVRKEKIAPPINSSKKVSGTENSSTDAKEAKQRILKTASPKLRKLETNNKEIGPRKEKIDTARTANARRAKPAPATTSSTVVPAQPPRKLTFRRGKVLNPDESSSSTPRRLRFRPAIAAADATARSRGSSRVASRRIGSGGAAARDAGAEVVVLRRRQDDGKETKKQEPGLFNNVIEETASRLVAEARKSKVKALVGAFETVISLQETSKAAAAPAMAAGVVVP